jgi:hypothetical protein
MQSSLIPMDRKVETQVLGNVMKRELVRAIDVVARDLEPLKPLIVRPVDHRLTTRLISLEGHESRVGAAGEVLAGLPGDVSGRGAIDLLPAGCERFAYEVGLHTRFAETVRQAPAEHDSSAGVWLSPADSGPVQGTDKGTYRVLRGHRQPIGARDVLAV